MNQEIVHYYFNKWSKDSSFRRILDMSCVQIYNSHTRCRQRSQSVGYQQRKKAFTTNSIFLSDNFGQILAFGSPKSGNHHDLNEIERILKEILGLLEEAKIKYKGLFLNADAGFDSKKFREMLSEKEIIANIPKNPRNSESSKDDFFIF